MAYYVIIRGPAGVGKSVVSRILANRINAEVVHFDKIMEELGLDYVQGEKWIPLVKFLKADEAMAPVFGKKLEAGKNLILDGNFYHKEQIEDLIRKLGSKYAIFTLRATLEECIKRDKSRENGLGEKATNDVFKLVSAFDYGTIIDTNDKSPENIANDILTKIANF